MAGRESGDEGLMGNLFGETTFGLRAHVKIPEPVIPAKAGIHCGEISAPSATSDLPSLP
jgi:hypothetical protein